MKRFATLASILLALAVASSSLAAGGLGKFQRKLSGKGAKTEKGMLDGTWSIDLASATSGPLHLIWDGKHTGGGTYAISGSTITFTPKKHGSCTTKAKYSFKLSGKKLTFTKITDSCSVREDVLIGVWTQVG